MFDYVYDPYNVFASPQSTPNYPLTGASATSLLGLTLTSLWLCGEASGNLADSVGSNTLTASGTPTYQRSLPDGRAGVYYDATGDKNILSPATPFGSSSAWAAAVFEMVTDPGGGNAGIVGELNGPLGASDGADISITTSTGVVSLMVRDTAALSLVTSGSTNIRAIGGLWLGQFQIDRTATTARARFSRWGGGATVQALSGSIAGFGALDGVLTMEFGLGCYGARVGGNAISWAAFATGAQCEGANLLANIAVAMGFE